MNLTLEGISPWDAERALSFAPKWTISTCKVDRFARTFSSEDLARVNPERVLDAGCSRGYVTMELARTYPQATVCGMEIYESRLPKKRVIEATNESGTVVFRKGDFYRLADRLTEGFFDAIFAMNNLLLKDDLSLLEHRLIAKNFHFALSEGGHLFMSRGEQHVILSRQGKGFNLEAYTDSFKSYPVYGMLTEAFGF